MKNSFFFLSLSGRKHDHCSQKQQTVVRYDAQITSLPPNKNIQFTASWKNRLNSSSIILSNWNGVVAMRRYKYMNIVYRTIWFHDRLLNFLTNILLQLIHLKWNCREYFSEKIPKETLFHARAHGHAPTVPHLCLSYLITVEPVASNTNVQRNQTGANRNQSEDRREPGISVNQASNPWFKDGQQLVKENLRVKALTHTARNVIIFIGDGMGISTVTAARIRDGQLRNETGEENFLSWERFPWSALVKTYNLNAQVGDSAASAVAILTGVLTNQGNTGISKYQPAYLSNCPASTHLHACLPA